MVGCSITARIVASALPATTGSGTTATDSKQNQQLVQGHATGSAHVDEKAFPLRFIEDDEEKIQV